MLGLDRVEINQVAANISCIIFVVAPCIL